MTDQGKERAKALADTLRDAGITAIITSQWIRAKDTAQPLANLLTITPQVVPTTDRPQEYFEAMANALRRLKDHTVLIVGHITVPNILAELGGPPLPTICESVFTDLFLLIPALGWDGLTKLHYGVGEDIPRAAEPCLICAPIRTSSDENSYISSSATLLKPQCPRPS